MKKTTANRSGHRLVGRPDRRILPSALALAALLFSSLPLAAQLRGPELYAVHPSPENVALGDVNNDGRIDLISGAREIAVQVFLQQGDGSFADAVQYPVSGGRSVDVGDFNDDGLNDVVTNADLGMVVLLQTEEGTLQATDTFVSNFAAIRVRVGDFNDDGLDDVATLPFGVNNDDVYVYFQGPQGLPLMPTTFTLLHSGFDDFEVGDLNDDGLDDLVASSGQGPIDDNIAVLLQNPMGGFFPQVLYDTPGDETSAAVAIGSLDTDQINDLVASRSTFQFGIAHFEQNESGTLDFSEVFATGPIGALEIGDLDGDGYGEILAIVGSKLNVYNSPRHPQGFFLRQAHALGFGNFNNPHSLAVGDIDGDGLPDVAVSNDNKGVQVLFADPTAIFSDGFESGNTSIWSLAQ